MLIKFIICLFFNVSHKFNESCINLENQAVLSDSQILSTLIYLLYILCSRIFSSFKMGYLIVHNSKRKKQVAECDIWRLLMIAIKKLFAKDCIICFKFKLNLLKQKLQIRSKTWKKGCWNTVLIKDRIYQHFYIPIKFVECLFFFILMKKLFMK